MKEMAERNADFWLRLDNAAKIYPAITNRELTSVFRLSARLKQPVRISCLLEAIAGIEERFPYYKVVKKTGFFWFYLERSHAPVKVGYDDDLPCRAFGRNEQLFRILVKDRYISAEFSHLIGDGGGAMELMRTLLLSYFSKCGTDVPEADYRLKPEEKPLPEEYEDAFKRFFKKLPVRKTVLPRAFHLPMPLNRKPRLRVINAHIPIKALKEEAKKHNMNITGYVVAVYMYSMQEIYKEMSPLQKRFAGKVIRMQVPINLRQMYPSVTMRNFSLYVLPDIDLRLGDYSFEEILRSVYHQMQLQTEKKLIGKMLSRNVSGERIWAVRVMPIFIKSLVLLYLYKRGAREYSGVVSNLGKIDFGEAVNSQLAGFTFVPPPMNKKCKINCAISSFGEELVITYGNISASRKLEQKVFSFLSSRGIPVRISEPYKKHQNG